MPGKRRKKKRGCFGRFLLMILIALGVFLIARPVLEKTVEEKNLKAEDLLNIADLKDALLCERLTTFSEVMNLIGQQTAAGETEFSISCTPELYQSLLQERQIPGSDAADTCALDDILESFAGASAYTFLLYDRLSAIHVSITDQLAGYRIIAAWETQNMDRLTDAEKETFASACDLAQQLKRGSEEETARAINDWICSSVTYTVDDTSEEDDSAIGAILRGKANCDGYSDAFYLIGTLAGLEVRVISGTGTSDMKNTSSGSGHMWNILKINGIWHHVDVTWADDDENGIILYCWLNVGSREMSRTHAWNRDSTVEIAEETDLSSRPENEYRVASAEDYPNAVADALRKNQKLAFFVFDSEESYQQRSSLEDCLRSAGFYGSYSYMELDQVQTVVFLNPYGTEAA